MTYSMPELLLVGAAQNLVLGNDSKILTDRNQLDGDNDGYSDGPDPFESAW